MPFSLKITKAKMKFELQTYSRKLLADTLTPVNIYLKLRDVYAGSILLESADYHGRENSLSYICCAPMAMFRVINDQIEMHFPDQSKSILPISSGSQVLDQLDYFRQCFESRDVTGMAGLYGYMTYDAGRYFEEIDLVVSEKPIPDVVYQVYRYVIVINHSSNDLVISENRLSDMMDSGLEQIEKIIYGSRCALFPFSKAGDEISKISDEQFLELVKFGRNHCFRGDVFQIVLSRRFEQRFKGDEFNVYRALRSINPSPYLFYFDYGNYRIFGSSPEAQLRIKDNTASIYPIAGTFRRSGNEKEDALIAEKLAADEKESAEHLMLVDLARNDLSRSADDVHVVVFKEIQYYSHVIHLVSKVSGKLRNGVSPLKVVADTFPAGTLSGAPKHKAMTLINGYEKTSRSFYGGAIGQLGFNGDFNHAIMIRTFLSKSNTLIYQAGAGVVAKSDPQNELQEVNNKLEALRKAMVLAEKI